MWGVWLYKSFYALFAVILLSSLVHNGGVVTSLGIVAVGVWSLVMTWIQTTNEEQAFQIARVVERRKRPGTLFWPLTGVRKELTRERFHQDFENYKWVGRLFGYPVGALFIGVGIWWTLKALSWTR